MVRTGKRVVITGLGIVSANGIGIDPFWKSLKEGKSGIKKVGSLNARQFNAQLAGEVADFHLDQFIESKGLRNLSKSSCFVLGAARMALDDARVDRNENGCRETGLVIGTYWGSLHNMCQIDQTLITEGVNGILPSFFLNVLFNIPASQGSIKLKMTSLNTTLSSGFPSGLNAIGYGYDMIRRGRVDRCLAGGVEEFCIELHQWMSILEMLSGTRNGVREFCAPFDVDRNGIILGEGGAILMLEEYEAARKRGARIYAEIIGYGSVFETCVMDRFLPKKKGVKRAIETALVDAGIGFEGIDYVCAHANSEVTTDKVEAEALQDFMATGRRDIPVSSIKSMTGECFGASGPLQIATGVMAMKEDLIPPTVNFTAADPGISLNIVSDLNVTQKVESVLVNSFDNNNYSSVIIQNYSDES